MASCFSCSTKKKEARRHLAEPGTPFGDLEDEDGRLLAQFAMRAKMSPVRSEYAQDVHRVVIQDFLACVEDEVTVRRGDCVRELFRDCDWMFVATTAGQTGFIPASYCRPISALINLPVGGSNSSPSSDSPALSRRPSTDSYGSMGLSVSSRASPSLGMGSVDSASLAGSVRRRTSASPSRLTTHGTGLSVSEWSGGGSSGGRETVDVSRAPSRTLVASHRMSLLAALGDDELSKQRIGLQMASGVSVQGSNDPSLANSPDSSSSSLMSSPSRLSRRYSFDSSSGSPLASPCKSLDSASTLSSSPRKSSVHGVAASPQCRRRVTGRGRQSRRTSQDMERASPQPSISSLPAVLKTVRLAYNFQASKDGELSLRNGDEVAVIREQGKDWLLVETQDGRQGLVPACMTITVSAVHAPLHSGRSRSSTTLNVIRTDAGPATGPKFSSSARNSSSAIGHGGIANGKNATSCGSRSAQTLPGGNRSAPGGKSAATSSPANIARIVSSDNHHDGGGGDRSATLTRDNVDQLRSAESYAGADVGAATTMTTSASHYEDLYSFARGRSSPGDGGGGGQKRRSHSASRTTLHRIAPADDRGSYDSGRAGQGRATGTATPDHNSDGEAATRSSSSALGKFFSRRSRQSDAGKPRSSPPADASSDIARGGQPYSNPDESGGCGRGRADDGDLLAHAWRNTNQPAYHRQRSRSASRSGMNRIDAAVAVEPPAAPAAPVLVPSTTTSAAATVPMTIIPTTAAQQQNGGVRSIPIGNAAVFTIATRITPGDEQDTAMTKARLRSATLQPGTSRAPTVPSTPALLRSAVHTRAPSMDETTTYTAATSSSPSSSRKTSPTTSSSSMTSPQQRQLRVLFNYTAMVGDELDVKAGNVVMETSARSKPGWAWVTEPTSGRHGYIPADFTEVSSTPIVNGNHGAVRTRTHDAQVSHHGNGGSQVKPSGEQLCTTI